MKEILVTGGAGYIGSNVVNLLIKKKYKVIIVDNLSTGHRKLIHRRASFYKVNILNTKELENIFNTHKIDTVIHLAGLSIIGESAKKPAVYFKNNVTGSTNLLKVMKKMGAKKIIFSSSASVYGKPRYIPLDESHPVRPISFYGKTKAVFEKKLKNFSARHGIRYLSLRYFNASGSSNGYGEIHIPETHLIPSAIKRLRKNEKITIFGNEYPTRDGTCIRDYVHVADIARAHVLGIKYLDSQRSRSGAMNLGSGRGYSVKQIVTLCSRVSKKTLKIKIAPRRKGDPSVLIASYKKAKKELGWSPRRSIHQIIKSAWEFEQKLYAEQIVT